MELSNTIVTKTGDDSLLPLGANWTGDGHIIYASTQNGNADIWKVGADGDGQKLLTSDESAEFSPSISADGRFLLFLSNRSGLMSVWRTKIDGTDPVRVTDRENVTDAIISRDGNTVFFVAESSDSPVQVLWKVSIDGKSKTKMTSFMTYAPRVSPDGKIVACYLLDQTTRKMRLTLLVAESGETIKQLSSPPSETVPLIDWTANGENLLLVLRQNKSSALWRLEIDEGKATKIYEWHDDSIFRFASSKDDDRVFFEKGLETNSVVLLNDLSREE
jgi:Tol biopolymer transport system component